MTSSTTRPKARAWVGGTVLAATLTTVLVGWSLSAPPGASPDDGYHLASIWCAEGFKEGRCLEDPGAPDLSRVLIPFSAPALVCFQQDGQRSAACAIDEQSSDLVVFSQVKESNIRRERPNLYYLAMHQLIGEDFAASMARMRGANIALAVLMVTLTALVAAAPLRRAFLLTTVLTSVPLGLFLVTSLNTSAWGLIGLTTLWANGLTVLDDERRRHRLAGAVLALVGVVLAFGSRSEAVVHIGIIATVLLMLGVRFPRGASATTDGPARPSLLARSREVALAGVILVTALVGLVSFAPRSAGLDDVLENLIEGHERLSARGLGDPLLAIAFEVPSLWTGALGHIWGLGALDTPIPTLATLPLSGVFVALLALGFRGSARPRFLAALLVGGALFAFPTLALLQAGVLVYEQLQPRQFMALLYLLLGLALVRSRSESEFRLGPGMRRLTLVLISVAHAVALLVTMRRHITGLTEFRYVSFTSPIEWWWTSMPPPNLVWLVTSVAFTIGLALILRAFPEERRGGAATPR